MPDAATDGRSALPMDESRARDTFARQHDHSDCGVACLASVVRYFGGTVRLERLRELSGTTKEGTTLLGLHQAAEELGLDAGAYEASMADLKALDRPCILHVIKNGRLQHYLLAYGYDEAAGEFVVADPASGVERMDPEAIDEMWQSRALLTLAPTDAFEAEDEDRRSRWAWAWALVYDDLNILFVAAALGLLISILGLSTAVFSQRLIDEILPSGTATRLGVALGLLGVLLLAKNGLAYLRRRFLVRQTREFNNRIIGYFYDTLLRLPQPFFFNRKVGDLVARMNDTRRLQRAVTNVLGDRMIDLIMILVSLTAIFAYAWPLGLVATAALPLFGVLAWAYHDPVVEAQQAVMEAHAANESNYVNTIEGMATVKATNREAWFSEMTRTVYGHYQDQIYGLGRIGVRFNFWTETSGTVVQVGVLALASVLVFREALALGVLVAVFQMTGMLVPAARRVATTNVQLQEARVAFDRMYELTSIEPAYDPDAEAQKADPTPFESLAARHLAFRFPGQERLLKDVSFSVERGEIVTLMGESGSGKSTLLRLLQRFYAPEAGTLTVNGDLAWDAVSVPKWRSLLGVMPQEPEVFNGTLLDNIVLDDVEDESEADAVVDFCRTYGFHEYFADFPRAYATVLGAEGTSLSGGQRQLVTLARALYRDPALLLLDEPTASMDRAMEEFVLDLLEDLADERAILTATHRARGARRADRVCILADGKINVRETSEVPMEEGYLSA
jgi:ABC-type bacteriocin/lantibiotic exporter with double-glycine peptidase domain